MLILVTGIVLVSVLDASNGSISAPEAGYAQTLDRMIRKDRADLAKHPHSGAALEALGLDLWLGESWQEALQCLKQAQSGYANADFARCTQRIGDCAIDANDFPQARLAYMQLAENDLASEGSLSAKLARDYNNIGLCDFLMSQSKVPSKECTDLLNRSLDYYRKAEKIFAARPENAAQLAFNQQNQALALLELGRKDEADRLTDMVQSRLKSLREPSRRSESLEKPRCNG